MAKWLAAAAAVVLALLIVLWREMRGAGSPEPVAPVAALDRAAHPAAAPAAPSLPVAQPRAVAAEVAPAVEPPAKPTKLDPRSDEFFWKVDEAVPKVVTRNAARCYEGRHGTLNRNQKLSLTYKVKVVDGQLAIRDVRVKESTLNDPALETCFLQEVQRSTWRDDELPDIEFDDMVLLRPERGMKKYWQDNLDYVGAEAPR
jgi:hypothetical protein